jgi:hypothetical protein
MRAVALAVVSAVIWADPILFVYFKEPAKTGVYYALSEDGCHFQPLNDGNPWLPPSQQGELMRDPFITRGPDGLFHMVWTWEWRVQSIGYASSPDLIHWSAQRQIPLMAGTPGAKNTWAPEIYWDGKKSKWLIIWSSAVEGRNPTNRIYHAFTSDFRTFTAPEIFFDPGYEVIDATLFHTRGRYWMVFKDERPNPLHKEIKIAQGPALEGPFSSISGPLTEPWSEGPSILEIGGRYVIYYDHYRDPKRYEAIEHQIWSTGRRSTTVSVSRLAASTAASSELRRKGIACDPRTRRRRRGEQQITAAIARASTT